MTNQALLYDEYKTTLEHIESVLNRRQRTSSFYITINSGIAALITVLLGGSEVFGPWILASLVLLLAAGFIASWVWRSLLKQYRVRLSWWYSKLREMETLIQGSTMLITKEYQELYQKPSDRLGMTKQETMITWIFSVLYLSFFLGTLIFLLL